MTASHQDDLATDADAFCRGIHPRLVGALSLHCGDREAAEELAQECLLRVWQRWDQVEVMEHPEAWTFRVAFNLSNSAFRRRVAERRALTRIGATAADLEPAEPAGRLVVRAAVARLPRRQRSALILRYFVDRSVEESARVMRCAPGTVKSLTSQALASLRREFEIDGEQEVLERA